MGEPMPLRKLVLNAVSAKMGGAANYLRTVVGELHRRELPFEVAVWVPSAQVEALRALAPRFRILAQDFEGRPGWKRLEFDQWKLRRFLEEERADVLFSTANLAMGRCPIRQVLLVRNSLWFSPLYLERLLPLKPRATQLREQARRALTVLSAKSAEVVMTPSQTLKEEMAGVLGSRADAVVVNPYGVEVERFAPRDGDVRAPDPDRAARLLFTGLYGEHKNLSTLLAAIERLEAAGVDVQLITTADPRRVEARSELQVADAARATRLEAAGRFSSPVQPLGPEKVAALYRNAEVFVYPSVVESFGHPLLEAMAAAIPIVAADVPINRELCQSAALYFSPFDAEACAIQIQNLLTSPLLRESLVRQGKERARLYTWSAHLDRLLLVLQG